MVRRICCITVTVVVAIVAGGILSGCDEMVDATHGAKGTAKMQGRREKRNSDAINLLDDAPKSNR